MITQGTLSDMLELSLVQELAQQARRTITSAYCRGRGIASSSDGDLFARTIWARDTALASLSSPAFSEEIIETIQTLISHQHESGIMPIRVGWIDVFWGYIWGFFGKRKWACLKEGTPWYELSMRAVPARDTAYSIVVACYNIFQSSKKGREFVRSIFPALIKALEAEYKHIDRSDQLVVSRGCSDWSDCLNRRGKLASVNMLRYQALRGASSMAQSIGQNKEAAQLLSRSRQVLKSCMETFWDDERGCFTASSKDKRLDVFANITACLALSDMSRCVRIQDAIEQEVRDSSGLLRCFSIPYPWYRISLIRTAGMTGYGNTFLYPCFSDLNILAQVRIATCHRDKMISREFVERASLRFAEQTNLYARLGSFHEILDPESLTPAYHPIFREQFHSHSGFVPAASAYLAAASALIRASSLGP